MLGRGIFEGLLGKKMHRNTLFIVALAISMASSAGGITINNASFEGTPHNTGEWIDGWDGTHDNGGTGWNNVFGVMSETAGYATETPHGQKWAFMSWYAGYATSLPGWSGVTVAIWTKIGTLEDNTGYVFGFLAGKGSSASDYVDNDFDISIWSGDGSGPVANVDSVTFSSPDGPGLTEEHTATLNSGTGHAGEDLYLVFSIREQAGIDWSQMLIDNVVCEAISNPLTAANPFPEDGDEGIGLAVVLSWDPPDPDLVSDPRYNVYFGRDPEDW